MEVDLKSIREDLHSHANPQKAKLLQGYFKTGEGEYGYGDIFLGLTVPEVRKIARKYDGASEETITSLLESKNHEERLAALLILVEKYRVGNENKKKRVYEFYMAHLHGVNNWDLVDLSAPKISGEFLWKKDKSILYSLIKSKNLWERRVAILSTFSFIKRGDFEDSLKIAEVLLYDQHDLIQKAVGWMLREIGKKDLAVEEKFLKTRYKTMPRTMLRYAIEKFDGDKRKKYLYGEI